MVICIAWTIPYLILVTYRNLIGPLDKTFALLMNFCKIFGTLCCLLTFFEITLIWYVFKMVLKAIPKMDDAEWAKVLILFNILVMASISYIMDMKGCYFFKVFQMYYQFLFVLHYILGPFEVHDYPR